MSSKSKIGSSRNNKAQMFNKANLRDKYRKSPERLLQPKYTNGPDHEKPFKFERTK